MVLPEQTAAAFDVPVEIQVVNCGDTSPVIVGVVDVFHIMTA